MEKKFSKLKKIQKQINDTYEVLEKNKDNKNAMKLEKKLMELVNKSVSLIVKSNNKERQPQS